MYDRRPVILLAIILSLNASLLPVDGSSHGMEGLSQEGCTCHGETPGATTQVNIQGIPENFTHGETYQLIISVSGGPAEAEQGHRGGFNLKASEGEFSPVDASTHVLTKGEITHEHAGANQRSWVVEWTAPYSDQDVMFTVAGNVVDGDHQPSDGDDWALASYTSLGSAVTLSDRVEQLKAPVLLALLFAIPALMLYRTNKK